MTRGQLLFFFGFFATALPLVFFGFFAADAGGGAGALSATSDGDGSFTLSACATFAADSSFFATFDGDDEVPVGLADVAYVPL